MAKIEKIYSITLEGEQELISKMNQVNQQFDTTKKNFTEIKNASKGAFKNDKDIEYYRKSLENLNKELLKNQTISKVLKNDNEAYLRVSESLNKIEKERAASINFTYESLKKANSEAKTYYSSKLSGKSSTSPLQGYQSNISQNLSEIKSSGNMVNFAAGYMSEQKKLESAQKRLNFEQSEYGKELAKTNIQITQQKKNNKEAAIEALGLADAYDELSRKQRESFNIAKNIGVEKGIYSREFQKAATEANYYDQQLKKVDFALGRFNRNVGNYKEGMFGLNNTMAQVMREMPAFTNSAQTGLMAISNNLPMLADAIEAVKVRNAELKQEFIESAAAARKMATDEALAAGASLELASAKGKEAEAMVMANYQAQKSPSVLKQVMSAMFSWQSLLAIGITLLTVYGKDIVEWVQKMFKAGKAIDVVAESQIHLNEALKSSDYKKAVREISELRNNIELAKEGFLSKDKVLKQYNETLGKVMGSAKSLDQVEQILTKNADNYIKATLYKAAANLALDKSAEEMLKAEQARQKKLEEYGNSLRDTSIRGGSMGMGGGTFNADEYEAEKRRIQKAREKDRQDEVKSAEKAAKAQEDIAKNFLKDAAIAAKGMNLDSTLGLKEPKTKKEKKYTGSKLTGEQNDFLKDLEATRNDLLANNEKLFLDSKIQEEEYLKNSLKIYVDYFNKKITYLKAGNAEERKQESQAQLDKVKMQSEINDKIYQLNKKSIDDELKQNEDAAKKKRDRVMNDPYSTEQMKIDAEQAYQEESYNSQLNYTQKMLDLNIMYSKDTIEETSELITTLKNKNDEINQSILKSKIDTLGADVNDIDRVKEQVENQNEINAAVERRSVLGDTRLNQQQKELELERINAQLSLNNTNAELGAVISKIIRFEQEIQKRKLNNDELREYNNLLKDKAILEGQKAEGEIAVRNATSKTKTLTLPGSGMSGLASGALKGIAGQDDKINIGGVDVTESAGIAIAQGFDIAQQAMSNYFDLERQRIEESKQLAYSRIDLQREQQLRYAQSKSEEQAIDKEAAQKKKKADQEAGEKLKKIKKSEAKIALATELANIAVAAASNPANGVTFGAAGIAMYSILAALALGRYAMTIGNINKTQFGRGGKFGLGGRLKGPSHSDNNGMPVINPRTNDIQAYLEGDEGIINKRSMNDNTKYTVSGTPSQIASKINAIGGGVDWLGGASISKFKSGGIFNWNRTQPPIFNSQIRAFEEAGQSFEKSERLDRIENNLEKLSLEGFKKVVLNPKDVTKFQKENQRQTEIGTL